MRAIHTIQAALKPAGLDNKKQSLNEKLRGRDGRFDA